MRTLLASLSLGLLLAAGAGCKAKFLAPPEVKDVVEVTVDEGGFKPDHIPAKRGRPITLVFKRTTDKTCATSVVMTTERINKDLPLDKPVMVSLIPERVGETKFACPMNMVVGVLDVRP